MAMIFTAHVANLGNDLDDKGYYRAVPYTTHFAHNAITSDILADLTKKGYTTPVERMKWGSYYFANTALVLFFEKLPLYSAFQSVFLAHLTLHLIGLLFLFFIAKYKFRKNGCYVFCLFALSLSSSILVCDWLFPFATNFFAPYTWITCYPRGPSVLYFFIALVCFLPDRNSNMPSVFSLIIGCAMLCLSFMAHRGGVQVYGAVFILTIIFHRLWKINYPFLFQSSVMVKKIVWTVNVLIAAIIIIKMGALISYLSFKGSFSMRGLYATNWVRSTMMASNIFFLLYLFASNALITFWAGTRRTADETNQMVSLGDHLFKIFVPFMIVTLGLFPLLPTSFDNAHIETFFLYEASRRIMGMTHILWWMVFGIGLYLSFYKRFQYAFNKVIVGWMLIILLSMTMNIYVSFKKNPGVVHRFLLNKRILTLKSSEIPAAGAANALTEDEIYHTIVNEYRARLHSAP